MGLLNNSTLVLRWQRNGLPSENENALDIDQWIQTV